MSTVKEHVKGKSEFQFYRKGELYYKTDDTGFEFRVPCNNDDAVLNKEEKSITLMKYISKELKMKNEALAEIGQWSELLTDKSGWPNVAEAVGNCLKDKAGI